MVRIDQAGRADLPAAAEVLAEAFEHDPVMAGFVPAGQDRLSRLAALFRALLRSGAAHDGVVDIARREDGKVVGVAVWDEPGRGGPSLTRQVLQLPGFLRAVGLAGVVRAARHQSVLVRHRPSTPHWYLGEIGVSRDGRGTGVGTALLASRLQIIDAVAQPAYLESSTPVNRRLYERFGFRTRALIEGIPGALPAAMWREGRTGPA